MGGSGVEKKTGFVYLLNLLAGRGGEGVVWLSVCGAPLDDWANGCSVEVFVHTCWVWF